MILNYSNILLPREGTFLGLINKRCLRSFSLTKPLVSLGHILGSEDREKKRVRPRFIEHLIAAKNNAHFIFTMVMKQVLLCSSVYWDYRVLEKLIEIIQAESTKARILWGNYWARRILRVGKYRRRLRRCQISTR